MKRTALIGTIAGAVLVLGGGAAVAASLATSSALDADPTPSISIVETPAAEDPTPEATSPLVAETPSVDGSTDVDAEFVAYVRGELLPSTGIANAEDDAIIAAGHMACEQLRAGVDSETLRLVEGEEAAPSGYFMDSAAIIDGARRFYCPDTIF